MMPRSARILLVAIALLAFAISAMAGEIPQASGDSFREDFHAFLDGLETLPGFPAEEIASARAAIDAASPEAQELIRAQLESTPAWRQIPEVMSAFAAGEVEYRRQELTRMIEAAMRPGEGPEHETENVERMRRAMLFMVDQLRTLSPIMEPEYEGNLARAAATIETLPASAVPNMYSMMGALAEQMKAQMHGEGDLTGLSEGPVAPTDGACGSKCDWDPTGACHKICHSVSDAIQAVADALKAAIDGFLSAVTGPINSMITAITNLPTTITNAFNGLFDRVKAFFTAAIDALVALIPSNPQEVFDAIIPAAVKSAGAIQGWIASAPTIPDLCPGKDVCGRGSLLCVGFSRTKAMRRS